MGLEQTAYSPTVIDKIVSANAEHKSANKAKKMLLKLADLSVSAPTIMNLTATIGEELQEQIQQQAAAHMQQKLERQYAEPPQVAAVSVDGGRIMTRDKAGRGIHGQQWKETKVACLLTMSSSPSDKDPHPELPACFANEKYVETLVRQMHGVRSGTQESPENSDILTDIELEEILDEVLEPETSCDRKKRKKAKWRPKKLVRTCVCSMSCSDAFGPLVAGEAQRRGFHEAERQAFLGDGQAWNWSIHEDRFKDFTPIVDFVHPLSYIFNAAKAVAPDDPWCFYIKSITDCWQGRVSDLLKELRSWQATHPVAREEELSDQDSRAVVQRAVTYLIGQRHFVALGYRKSCT